jgi:hypothetical protein
MNKYIEELITEMLFDFNDLALGHSYKSIGYDTKKEFFDEMSSKMNELYSRLDKEASPTVTSKLKEFFESQDPSKLMEALKCS